MTELGTLPAHDVCVIGAGPAGLTLALELAERGVSVVLVESGFDDTDERAQRLSDADLLSPGSHSEMNDAVRRGLGGTSALWGGRCVPLDPIDFESRSFAHEASWPFGEEELARFYPRACYLLGIGKASFNAGGQENPTLANRVLSSKFSDSELVCATKLERWCPQPNIWNLLRKRVESNPKITLLQGKTCVGFVQSAVNERVSVAIFKSTHGTVAEQLKAREFIIACGGVESTRLILNSVADPSGLKSLSPQLIGRYYMGHLSGKIADIKLAGNPADTLYGFEKDNGVYVRRRITFNSSVFQSHGLLNIAFWLDNPNIADWRHGSGILSAAYLALTAPIVGQFLAPAAIRKRAAGDGPVNRWPHIRNCFRSPLKTIEFCFSFCYQRYIAIPRIPGFFTYSAINRYALHYHAEQAPNWHSTIELSESVDALGMRRALVNLKWSDQDVTSIINAHRLLDSTLRTNGIGKLTYKFHESEMSAAVKSQAMDGFHQMGTLRMSVSSDGGVTDPYGRLFGASNCYVSSSAIFPSSGQANPTLPLVAMAVRQAEHIAAKLTSAKSAYA